MHWPEVSADLGRFFFFLLFFLSKRNVLPHDSVVCLTKWISWIQNMVMVSLVSWITDELSPCLLGYGSSTLYHLKMALQILGRQVYRNTEKSSLYSQSLLIFIHKTPVVKSHPTTREIRDLLLPRSTPTGNTVYFYMSYILKTH